MEEGHSDPAFDARALGNISRAKGVLIVAGAGEPPHRAGVVCRGWAAVWAGATPASAPPTRGGGDSARGGGVGGRVFGGFKKTPKKPNP